MDRHLSRRAILLWAAALAAALFLVLSLLSIPYVSVFAQVMLAGLGLLAFLGLLFWLYRAFLWKVGRRLALSYFLIGVLPIPMVLLLLTVVSYLLAGFFLGHLYRDAVEEVQVELQEEAGVRAEAFARTGAVPREPPPRAIVFGYYQDGRRIGGDPLTPAAWPVGIRAESRRGEIADSEPALRFYARRNGDPALAASAGDAGRGVVALYAGDLSGEVSRRAGLWVEIEKPGELDLEVVNVAIGEHRIPLQRLGGMGRDGNPEAEKFMKQLSKGERFWDDALLSWVEISGPLLDPVSGRMLSEYVPAVLSGTPRIIASHLFTGSSVDTATWGALLVLSLLLLNVYGVAVLMAVFMIFGLSFAVNRLSRATEAVRQGDFSVRIPVRRKDQVGDLQRSFNQMAGDLEALVATATQKELLEKELALARDLQKSLLPSKLPSGHGTAMAALFEPSAAIGGDYFDVLRLSEGVLAVFIADVSGHGLPAGLRMAMLKAALGVLVSETRDPEEILRRLDDVVRTNGERRFFVTATLALVDLTAGRLQLINAGHPPTYLIRDGQTREIMLPGSPLGGLGKTYGRATVDLQAGDYLVWLSDGLIEAPNAAGEPFGYESVVSALSGTHPFQPEELRDRLVAAIARHAGGQPPSDDRTMLVLGYRG